MDIFEDISVFILDVLVIGGIAVVFAWAGWRIFAGKPEEYRKPKDDDF